MRKKYLAGVVCMLHVLLVTTGCCVLSFSTGCGLTAKYERTEFVSVPLPAGKLLDIKGHNGSITIKGGDGHECKGTAQIIVRAAREEDAQYLAERVKIKLETASGGLNIRINELVTTIRHSTCVNFILDVPRQINLKLNTHNGAVELSHILGRVNAVTHNGAVTVSDLVGNLQVQTHNGSVCVTEITGDDIRLETHNGKISCREISGDISACTHNGALKIAYAGNAPGPGRAKLVTYNGDIDFTGPDDLSAEVDISTHNGSINTALPLLIKGKIEKRHLRGIIGKGEGKLVVVTHNGSIRIK